jgi:hypothetical protein
VVVVQIAVENWFMVRYTIAKLSKLSKLLKSKIEN